MLYPAELREQQNDYNIQEQIEQKIGNITEKIDTSNAVGRMFIKIIGIFAEFERENLAERVSLGYEQKTREDHLINEINSLSFGSNESSNNFSYFL